MVIKNLVYIFDFIIKFAGYYIHKVRWFLKLPIFEQFKTDIKMYLVLKCIRLYLQYK